MKMTSKRNFIVVPSLEHAASVVIGAALWNQKLLLYNVIASTTYNCEHEKIKNEINEDIKTLPFPSKTKNELSHIVKLMGDQILTWIKDYFVDIGSSLQLPMSCVWKNSGLIDNDNTARIIFFPVIRLVDPKMISSELEKLTGEEIICILRHLKHNKTVSKSCYDLCNKNIDVKN